MRKSPHRGQRVPQETSISVPSCQAAAGGSRLLWILGVTWSGTSNQFPSHTIDRVFKKRYLRWIRFNLALFKCVFVLWTSSFIVSYSTFFSLNDYLVSFNLFYCLKCQQWCWSWLSLQVESQWTVIFECEFIPSVRHLLFCRSALEYGVFCTCSFVVLEDYTSLRPNCLIYGNI